jgi:hypothetical protein
MRRSAYTPADAQPDEVVTWVLRSTSDGNHDGNDSSRQRPVAIIDSHVLPARPARAGHPLHPKSGRSAVRPELAQAGLLAGAVAVPGEFGAGLRVAGWRGSLPLGGAAGDSG